MESGVSEDLPQTIPGVLARAAERFGDREALVDERARMSYAELSEAATRAARSLIASGIEPGRSRVDLGAEHHGVGDRGARHLPRRCGAGAR